MALCRPETAEFVAITQIKFELGDDVIDVGKRALFVLGHYAGIEERESEIKLLSEGFSIRYTGDAEVTHVSARRFQVYATASDSPDSTIGTEES
jgi:hypothetical protein